MSLFSEIRDVAHNTSNLLLKTGTLAVARGGTGTTTSTGTGSVVLSNRPVLNGLNIENSYGLSLLPSDFINDTSTMVDFHIGGNRADAPSYIAVSRNGMAGNKFLPSLESASNMRPLVLSASDIRLNTSPGNGNVMIGRDNGGNLGIGTSAPTQRLHVIGNILASGTVTSGTTVLTSDDRVKTDKAVIENAMATLNKLNPKTYTKWSSIGALNDSNASSPTRESGFIAQEVFYQAPELRHLVVLPSDADLSDSTNPTWGSDISSINYVGLIGYLVKALQEKDSQLIQIETRLSNAGL
jgi:hypothetical protein